MDTRRRIGIAAGLAVAGLLALGPGAGAANTVRYKGARYDIFSGAEIGRWAIRTTAHDGGALLKVLVRCKPRRTCRPFPSRLRVDMTRQGEPNLYEGTFALGTARCSLNAYVYPGGFEGSYYCGGGSFGSISGRSGKQDAHG